MPKLMSVNTVPCENGYIVSIVYSDHQDNFVAKTTDEAVEIYNGALLKNFSQNLKIQK